MSKINKKKRVVKIADLVSIITVIVAFVMFGIDNCSEFFKFSTRFRGNQKVNQVLRIKYNIEDNEVVSRVKLAFYLFITIFILFVVFLIKRRMTVFIVIYGFITFCSIFLWVVEQSGKFKHRGEIITLKDSVGDIWVIQSQLQGNEYVKVKIDNPDMIQVCSRKEII